MFVRKISPLVLLVGFLVPCDILVAQVPLEKSESTFTVPNGLEIKLWASEPLFVNPTTFDIDEKGRTWVCEAVNYRRKLRNQPPLRSEGDRIVIVVDTDGDGKADKATTFYQAPHVMSPLGIAVMKDMKGPGRKVYYCQSPDIMVLEDKDGDDKADGPPTKLLTGFQGIDHDHGVHGISIGPDGKLYFSVGDAGVRDLQSANGKGKKWTSNTTDLRAGTVWRCDTDGNNLQLVAHNFRNNYMPAIDSYGTVFISDNDDDGNQQTRICYVMPGGNFGYHPRGPGQTHWHEEEPGVVPKILRTFFGSPTGMCMYEAQLLPASYQGQPLHTDAGPRNLRCYHTKIDGAGFSVEQENMISSTDGWFRPSDVKVAPDGSVYIADWYDPGVGGHGMGDTTRGRIYRLAPKGHKSNVPSIDYSTNDGIVAALSSGCNATRFIAIQHILAMDPIKRNQVAKIIFSDPEITRKPWVAARILWFVDFPKQLPSGLDQREEFKWLEIRKLVNAHPGLVGLNSDEKSRVDFLAANGGPGVARELLVSLRDSDDQNSRKWFYDLAKKYDGKDVFLLKAIGVAAGADPSHREIVLADFQKQFTSWSPAVGDLVFELRPKGMVSGLGDMLSKTDIPLEQKLKILNILASNNSPSDAQAFLTLVNSKTDIEVREKAVEWLKIFLPGKWSSTASTPELAKTVNELLSGNADDQRIGLGIVEAAKPKGFADKVSRLALESKDVRVQKQAVVALGTLAEKQSVETLRKILQDNNNLSQDSANALAALGQNKGKGAGFQDAIIALQSVFNDHSAPVSKKIIVANALAGTRNGSDFLLVKASENMPDELKQDVGRLLRNSPFQDLRNKAMIAYPAPGKLDPKKLPALSLLALKKGDVVRGKSLMNSSGNSQLQCLKCHTVQGNGGAIGPDLSMIGKKATKENLYESIINPSKAIADQYLTWIIETKKGQVLTGLIVEESPEFVVLRDGNGKDYKIERKDVESKAKGPNSLMPSDLINSMTEQDLVDLVDYLATLQTASFTPDWFHIVGPFENGPADANFEKQGEPETKVDLEKKINGKSGSIGWSKIRTASNGYLNLALHFSPDNKEIISYLYQVIDSPIDQDATILVGADDCVKIWLNNAEVFKDKNHFAAQPARNSVPIKLKKGLNPVLIKINNGDGEHGLFFSISSKEIVKIASKN